VIAAHAADLERANAELTRSNKDLAQFAYAASHDLSEPLRCISGFADLLRVRYHGSLDTDADAFLDFIAAGTARMQHLIDDLLAHSRVTTRAQPLTPVDLREVLDTVLADLDARIHDTGARVRIDTPLPVVTGDATQLTQVFTNLIRNAITFHAPGTTPDVHVSADRDGRCWRFTVADNGIGIPPNTGNGSSACSNDSTPGTPTPAPASAWPSCRKPCTTTAAPSPSPTTPAAAPGSP